MTPPASRLTVVAVPRRRVPRRPYPRQKMNPSGAKRLSKKASDDASRPPLPRLDRSLRKLTWMLRLRQSAETQEAPSDSRTKGTARGQKLKAASSSHGTQDPLRTHAHDRKPPGTPEARERPVDKSLKRQEAPKGPRNRPADTPTTISPQGPRSKGTARGQKLKA